MRLSTHLLLCMLALIAPVLVDRSVFAQAADEPTTTRGSRPALLIDLAFKGGTVASYLDAVRQVAADTNVVVMPDASDVELPPVTLRRASVPAAIRLLHGQRHTTAVADIMLLVEDVETATVEESRIWVVNAKVDRKDQPNTLGSRDLTRVWSVSDLLEDEVKAEALLSAVETALDLLKDEYPPAQIRFHADTGLLIARGHGAQIGVIDDVMQQLWETRKRIREDAMKNLHAQHINLQSTAVDLQQRVQQLTAERDHLLQTNQATDAIRRQLEDAQAELWSRLMDRDGEVAQLKAQLVEARNQLRDGQGSADGRPR